MGLLIRLRKDGTGTESFGFTCPRSGPTLA
jgi:hypothetical protein